MVYVVPAVGLGLFFVFAIGYVITGAMWALWTRLEGDRKPKTLVWNRQSKDRNPRTRIWDRRTRDRKPKTRIWNQRTQSWEDYGEARIWNESTQSWEEPSWIKRTQSRVESGTSRADVEEKVCIVGGIVSVGLFLLVLFIGYSITDDIRWITWAWVGLTLLGFALAILISWLESK